RVAFQLRYATLLCVARQVVPQLENLNAIARNQRFEFPDRLSELLYICLFAWFFVQQSEQGRIPGAKYNAGAALCRQVLPIAPKERKLSFLLAGRPERQGADMSRIHPLVDQIHGGTLAGTIDARHNDQQAALWILQARILRLKKFSTQLGNERPGFFLGNLRVAFGLLEASGRRRHGKFRRKTFVAER